MLFPSAQDKIKSSSVLIVGAGGLGCPVAQYLAAAGIGGCGHVMCGCGLIISGCVLAGHMGIIDYDEVEISNLHRQVGVAL